MFHWEPTAVRLIFLRVGCVSQLGARGKPKLRGGQGSGEGQPTFRGEENRAPENRIFLKRRERERAGEESTHEWTGLFCSSNC